MSYTLPLSKELPHRIACHIHFRKDKAECIIDTACMNTLIPLFLAKKHGRRLNKTHTVVVGGGVYEATAYSFDNITLGGYRIPRLVAFCANYTGILKTNVLLGLNVLNNLRYTISRNQDTFDFDINIWSLVQDKPYPFAMFFDMDDGMKPVYPSLLIEHEHEGADEGGA